jgi:hypothetical protein
VLLRKHLLARHHLWSRSQMSLDANSSMPAARLRGQNSAARSAGSRRDGDHRRGVVMLMQPFFADALFLVVRDHAVRHVMFIIVSKVRE